MPHHPKPWYRRDRGLWYVQLDGKQHNLGPDEQLAFKRYHELMAAPKAMPTASNSVVALIDTFLDWVKIHCRSNHTFEWYRSRLQLFAKRYPDLTVEHLKPFHVQQWIDAYPHLSNGSKRNYCRAIQRAMRWAEELGYIERSPIAHFKKPPAGRRERVVSQAEFDLMLSLTRDREFRELLTVTWETGCRPQESLRVEARHVDLGNARWVFPVSESKTRLPRIVYLTEAALAITQRLLLRYPNGTLFRNTAGAAWTTDAVNCRFQTIEKKTGIKYCLYHLRHTWMNRLLTAGVDSLTVAILAGHCDPSTLAKTYQHLSQDPSYLLQMARKLSA